jgi:hypothetical protein
MFSGQDISHIPPTASIEYPCDDELFSLVDTETNTVIAEKPQDAPSSDDYPCDDELFSLVDTETNTVIAEKPQDAPSSDDYPCDNELFNYLVDTETDTVMAEKPQDAPSSDDYPCDNELFSLVDAETNTIASVYNRVFSMSLISRTPTVEVVAAASQRLAGISRLLTSLEHPATLPYALTCPPHMVFLIHVPPDNFSVPPNLLRQKTINLQKLCENAIFAAFGTHSCTETQPKHHFFVQTLLPPFSQLKLDGRFDHHPTPQYRRSWSHRPPHSLFATGFAEILNLDHQRDIWIILVDRGCDFAGWRVWAEQMKKCTQNSMFGVALRLFYFYFASPGENTYLLYSCQCFYRPNDTLLESTNNSTIQPRRQILLVSLRLHRCRFQQVIAKASRPAGELFSCCVWLTLGLR